MVTFEDNCQFLKSNRRRLSSSFLALRFREFPTMNQIEQFFDFDEEPTDRADQYGAGQLNEAGGYICDHCGEEIVVPIDVTEGTTQEYVEDCPVCCNPNIIFVDIDLDGQVRVSSRAEQDH